VLHRTTGARGAARLIVMELIILLIAPLPIGFLVRNRLVAFLAYIALHAFVFTFQSVALVTEWVAGRSDAFGKFPEASSTEVFAYGVVNLVIYAAGLGLVYLGSRLAARRRGPVALEA
jgi:hypothetical protein